MVLSMKQVAADGKVWQLKQVYWVLPPVDWYSHNEDEEAEEESGDVDDDDMGALILVAGFQWITMLVIDTVTLNIFGQTGSVWKNYSAADS